MPDSPLDYSSSGMPPLEVPRFVQQPPSSALDSQGFLVGSVAPAVQSVPNPPLPLSPSPLSGSNLNLSNINVEGQSSPGNVSLSQNGSINSVNLSGAKGSSSSSGPKSGSSNFNQVGGQSPSIPNVVNANSSGVSPKGSVVQNVNGQNFVGSQNFVAGQISVVHDSAGNSVGVSNSVGQCADESGSHSGIVDAEMVSADGLDTECDELSLMSAKSFVTFFPWLLSKRSVGGVSQVIANVFPRVVLRGRVNAKICNGLSIISYGVLCLAQCQRP